MEETDSERNIRLGKEAGAIVVQASGTAVGSHQNRSPLNDWKRDQVDDVVRKALAEGIADPEEIKRRKLERLEQLRMI